jgi:hypothetical protein
MRRPQSNRAREAKALISFFRTMPMPHAYSAEMREGILYGFPALSE